MISQSLSHSKRKGTLARSFCECCCLVRANRGALGCFGLCVPTPRECPKVQHWDRPPGSHLLLFWAPKHAQILPLACSCVPHPRGRWKEGLVIFSRSQQRVITGEEHGIGKNSCLTSLIPFHGILKEWEPILAITATLSAYFTY